MNAFCYLRDQFEGYIDTQDITYKKNKSYIAILYQGNAGKWLCRMMVYNNQIVLLLPDAEKKEIRCCCANFYEIGNYTRYMLSVLSRYTRLNRPLEQQNLPMYQVVTARRYPKYSAPGPTDWLDHIKR